MLKKKKKKKSKKVGKFLSDSSRADGRTGRLAVRQASHDTTEDGKHRPTDTN